MSKAEKRFWVRWANGKLSERGITIQRFPEDLENGSAVLHLIEILDHSCCFYIPGHSLCTNTMGSVSKNIILIIQYLSSKGKPLYSTPEELTKSFVNPTLIFSTLAEASVSFQGIRIAQTARVEEKLLQYLQNDMKDTSIKTLTSILQDNSLFSLFLQNFLDELPSGAPTLEDLLYNVESNMNISHLLDMPDFEEIEKFSKTSVLLYFMNFYHNQSTIMQKRYNYNCNDMICSQANAILKEMYSKRFLSTQNVADCFDLSSELCNVTQNDNNIQKNVDSLMACISSLQATSIGYETQEKFLLLMRQVSVVLDNYQNTQNDSNLLIGSLKEQMQVMNTRFQREIQQNKKENLILQERMLLMEKQLIEEQQKKEELLFLIRDMGRALERVEQERYREEVQHSILDTLSQREDMINGQQNEYDEENITPVCVDALLLEIENLSCDSDDEETEKINETQMQSMLTLQHFGYLHEVINAQKEMIKALQENVSHGGENISTGITSGENAGGVCFGETQKKIQIDKQRNSLSQYIKTLQNDIEKQKKQLQTISRK